MEQPPQILQEAVDKANAAEWWHTIEAALGDPPDGWEQWTNSAEEGLLTSLGIPRQGADYRGGYAPQDERLAGRKIGSAQ